MATLRIVSLWLAAIAILIFGVAMDIGDKDREALCGGRATARIAVPKGASPYIGTHRRREDRSVPPRLRRDAKLAVGRCVPRPGRDVPEGRHFPAGYRGSLVSSRALRPVASARTGTARRHWRRSPVQPDRRDHSDRGGSGRRALPAAGADRARPHAGRPGRLLCFRSDDDRPGAAQCAGGVLAPRRGPRLRADRHRLRRLRSTPARSTSTRPCSIVSSQAGSSSIKRRKSISGPATAASAVQSTGSGIERSQSRPSRARPS